MLGHEEQQKLQFIKLGYTPNVATVLAKSGVIGQLSVDNMTDEQLLALKGFGRGSLEHARKIRQP